MPAPSTIAIFLLAGLGILLIPGPAVLYIVTRSVAQGRRAGLASVGGIETANLVHLVAAALGLSALLMTSALAFSVVKYLGAAYLIFLGVRTLLSRNTHLALSTPKSQRLSKLFANGFLVNLLSPKAALFYYAFLPQFVDPARGSVVEQLLLLGITFGVLPVAPTVSTPCWVQRSGSCSGAVCGSSMQAATSLGASTFYLAWLLPSLVPKNARQVHTCESSRYRLQLHPARCTSLMEMLSTHTQARFLFATCDSRLATHSPTHIKTHIVKPRSHSCCPVSKRSGLPLV